MLVVNINVRATIKNKSGSYICVILPFGLKEKLLFCNNAANSLRESIYRRHFAVWGNSPLSPFISKLVHNFGLSSSSVFGKFGL